MKEGLCRVMHLWSGRHARAGLELALLFAPSFDDLFLFLFEFLAKFDAVLPDRFFLGSHGTRPICWCQRCIVPKILN